MSETYLEIAKKLAARPYLIVKSKDETTTGKSIYLARALEIENCFGQGNTPEEAEQDFRAALVDFIEGLLEDGLRVPEPAHLVKTESTGVATTITVINKKVQTVEVNNQNSYVLAVNA